MLSLESKPARGTSSLAARHTRLRKGPLLLLLLLLLLLTLELALVRSSCW